MFLEPKTQTIYLKQILTGSMRKEVKVTNLYEAIMKMHSEKSTSQSRIILESFVDSVLHYLFSKWAVHYVILHAKPICSKSIPTH